MNNSTVNFTSLETTTNSTTHFTGLMDDLEISVCSISFLFGFPIHSYIIWLIITGSGVASEFFILNLSVCEISNSLNSFIILLPFALHFTPSSPLSHVSPAFSYLIILPKFLSGLVVTGHPLLQCLMCVECYLAVDYPVTFLKFKPLRYRVICCTVVWIFILGSCLACMITLMLYNINAHTWFFITKFLLLLCIQLFCLVAVLRALKQSGPGERKKEEENPMKRRAFHLILITTVNMVITYVPVIISGVFIILKNHYNLGYWAPGFVCYILPGFVQTVLYLQRAGKLSCLCFP